MFGEIVIVITLLAVSLAELTANGPYAPSGWRPQGATFNLPIEYFASQAQITPRVELEITKERVDYAGELSEENTPPVELNNAYLPADEIEESSGIDIIRVQDLPSRPGVQFNRFRSPQLNTREYYPTRQISQFRRLQKFTGGNSNNIGFERQQLLPFKFSSTQYGTPAVEQSSTQYELPGNHAAGYTFTRPVEPFNKENEEISESSVTKGEYFVLTPEKNLQKVSYKTSQTEEEARTNAFTAELKYTPVEKIEGPLYKYNEQGQLVRIYKK